DSPGPLAAAGRVVVCRLIQVDDAALQGEGRGVGAVADAELAQDIVDVNLDRAFRNRQVGGDDLIALALGDVFQDFKLARRQLRAVHALGQPAGDFGRDAALPCVDGADGFNQLVAQHVLEQVSARPGLQGAVDVFV